MTSSLVGSEMCIRDSILTTTLALKHKPTVPSAPSTQTPFTADSQPKYWCCLLYTSDAADDM
eukprot:659159-Prorocentrum_lima.AAC.1